jgi:hypothetical protein
LALEDLAAAESPAAGPPPWRRVPGNELAAIVDYLGAVNPDPAALSSKQLDSLAARAAGKLKPFGLGVDRSFLSA